MLHAYLNREFLKIKELYLRTKEILSWNKSVV